MRSFLKALVRKYERAVDYLEIRVEESEETAIHISESNMEKLHVGFEKGGCIRALYKGGWGFVTFNDLNESSIDKCILSAIKQATLMRKVISRLADINAMDITIPLNVVTDPREISFANKMDILLEYRNLISSLHSNILPLSITYNDIYKHSWLCTSDGTFLEKECIDINGAIVPMAYRTKQIQFYAVGFGSSNDFNVIRNLENRILNACRLSSLLLDSQALQKGKYTIVADQNFAGALLQLCLALNCEGDKSDFVELGRTIAQKHLSVYDTGLAIGSRGSILYDDEGVKAEQTYLINNGIFIGKLHSRETAGEAGDRATGNARAINYKFAPIPRVRTTCIAQGETPFEEMLRDIKAGVLMLGCVGGQGGTTASLSASHGYMIHDGKIGKMVKNPTLSDNIFHIIRNIDAVGNDFQFFESGGGLSKGAQYPLPAATGSPTIKISDVLII